MMLTAELGQEGAVFAHFERLKGLLRRFERLGVPVVAAINGTALGGGLEFCLAAHHRIAVPGPKVELGLPEVDFGILPAAGGVVRLTRLLGRERALPFLLGGKRSTVEQALAAGIIDRIASDNAEMMALARQWALEHRDAKQPWDARAMPESQGDAGDEVAQGESDPDNEAVAEIARIARLAERIDFDEALREETHGFVKLVMTSNAKRRIDQFFQRNAARQSPQGSN